MTRWANTPEQTLTYDLTVTDALAWEARPQEASGWRHAGFLLWLGLAGFALAFVPEYLVGPEGGLRFYLWLLGLIALQWGLATLATRLMAHLRARRRVPRPLVRRLDIFPRRLVERRDLAEPVVVTPDRIAAVLATPGHVIIAAGRDVVIIPARAFADESAMQGFAARWDSLSQAAQP